MRREIWAFVVLTAILLLLFRFSGGDWRVWRERLFTTPGDSVAVENEDMRVDGDYAKVAGEMQNYVDWLHEAGISDRLERITDSLHAVLGDLEERREKVEKAGSLAGFRESESYDEDFWKAAHALQELERASTSALVDVDSIRTRLVLEGERKAPSVSRAAEIRWNEPERVGVREACLSCHQELDGSGQVLLTPGRDNEKYPEPMLHHSPREFGCTVCHRGASQALDFERSHGLDDQGRPFRPGKLALRSCGFCHDRIAKAAARMTEWPEACVNCHAGQSLARLSPDSLLHDSGHDPVNAERNARTWLVRHWSVKTGRIPEREDFERVFSGIVSGSGNHGRLRNSGEAEDSGAELKKGTQLICPSCGRRFRAAGDMKEYFCPLDGTKLERLEKE